VGILLLIFSVWVIKESRGLVYMVEFSPGAGFFPFWLGVSLLVLSLILFLGNTIINLHGTEANPLPAKQALFRIVLILGALLLSILIFESLGFLLSMTLLIAFLLMILEKHRWYSAIPMSLVMVCSIYGIFKVWLGIPLPLGIFP
jgi:putative tricarboxylic transport membrane protein